MNTVRQPVPKWMLRGRAVSGTRPSSSAVLLELMTTCASRGVSIGKPPRNRNVASGGCMVTDLPSYLLVLIEVSSSQGSSNGQTQIDRQYPSRTCREAFEDPVGGKARGTGPVSNRIVNGPRRRSLCGSSRYCKLLIGFHQNAITLSCISQVAVLGKTV